MEGPPAHRFLPKLPRQLPDNGRQPAPRKKKQQRKNHSKQSAARVPYSGQQVGQEGVDQHRTHKYQPTREHRSHLLAQQ